MQRLSLDEYPYTAAWCSWASCQELTDPDLCQPHPPCFLIQPDSRRAYLVMTAGTAAGGTVIMLAGVLFAVARQNLSSAKTKPLPSDQLPSEINGPAFLGIGGHQSKRQWCQRQLGVNKIMRRGTPHEKQLAAQSQESITLLSTALPEASPASMPRRCTNRMTYTPIPSFDYCSDHLAADPSLFLSAPLLC